MWYDSLDTLMSMLMLGIMAALLRAAYEAYRPKSPIATNITQERQNNLLASTALKPVSPAEANNSFAPTSQQKAWAEKAIQRYAASQEKKWRRWNEAMFEPK